VGETASLFAGHKNLVSPFFFKEFSVCFKDLFREGRRSFFRKVGLFIKKEKPATTPAFLKPLTVSSLDR